MAGAVFTPSYQGLGDNVLRADFMVAEMARRGQAVMDRAIATAPVYSGPGADEHRGRYKASFSMTTTSHGGSKGNRACAYIENSAPEAVDVEFGTRASRYAPGGDRGHATLRNALNAAGD